MNRRRFVVGSAAVAGAGVALVADGCSTLRSLTPGAFVPASNYTLNVGYATSNINGFVLKTRTYNGATAGPTIEAYPGATLTITVNNHLPPNPPASIPQAHSVRVPLYQRPGEARKSRLVGTRAATAPIDPMNNPNSFNTTNLHVHGIQTVPHLYNPIGTSDPSAEMIAIEPGQSFTYSLPIPPDQPSGLYWYHPHHHGATDVQVSGGMAGLIAVRGPIDQVPEIAAAREIFLVVQSLQVNQGPNGTYVYEPVAYSTGPNAYTGETDFVMMTVNGHGVLWIDQSNPNAQPTYTNFGAPTIEMQPGEVIRLRMLNGTNGTYLPLVFPGMNCYLIANDGVNLPEPVQLTLNYTGTIDQFNIMQVQNALGTSPGNRVELLLQAPQTPGSYALSAAAQNNIEVQLPAFTLANFVVAGSPVTMSIPSALPLPTRDAPIADSEIVNRRTITFHEAITQPAGFDTILTGFWPYIDDALFDEMTIDYHLGLGTAEEWTIVNGTMCGHPFHVHVNSYELIAINGVPVSPPQVWDTFMVPPAQANYGNMVDGMTPVGSITIRIRFKEWTGKSVLHCHVLNHEDTGMMKNFLIQ